MIEYRENWQRDLTFSRTLRSLSMAGDAFFAKANKRKRAPSSSARNGPVKKFRKPTGAKPTQNAFTSKRRDEELDSQHTESDDNIGGDLDDLELRESDIDEHASGEEDENETAAQKRLRLAKVYLQGVKDDLGELDSTIFMNHTRFFIPMFLTNIINLTGDGEVDAADLDRELISSRLRQDVVSFMLLNPISVRSALLIFWVS